MNLKYKTFPFWLLFIFMPEISSVKLHGEGNYVLSTRCPRVHSHDNLNQQHSSAYLRLAEVSSHIQQTECHRISPQLPKRSKRFCQSWVGLSRSRTRKISNKSLRIVTVTEGYLERIKPPTLMIEAAYWDPEREDLTSLGAQLANDHIVCLDFWRSAKLLLL